MDEYLKETKPPARSTSPDVYMPLRLQCSLRGSENDEIGGSVTGLGRGTAGAGGGRLVSSSGRGAAGGQQGEAFGLVASASEIRAKLSLRGEMIVPALGVRLTPIAPLALLHTALYQSLLTRGGEAKPQSG